MSARIALVHLAHARSGDKGDTANVGLIALEQRWYPVLAKHVTRDAVAAVAGVELVRSPELEQQLRERFAAYRYEMPETVLRQADVPVGATPLDNPVGSAPGLRVAVGDALVFALPGPPHELAGAGQDGVRASGRQRGAHAALFSQGHAW